MLLHAESVLHSQSPGSRVSVALVRERSSTEPLNQPALMLFWQFCSTFLPLVVAPTAAYTTVLCSKQQRRRQQQEQHSVGCQVWEVQRVEGQHILEVAEVLVCRGV
jgi:hypothetical protein